MRKWWPWILVVLLVFLLVVGVWLRQRQGRYSTSVVIEPINETAPTVAAGVAVPTGTVSITSEVEGVTVVADRSALDQLLTGAGLWQGQSVVDYRNIAQPITPKSLQVKLVDVVADPYTSQRDNDGSNLIQAGVKVSPEGIITVEIGIGPNVKNLSGGSETAWLDAYFWNAMYMALRHRGKPQGGINNEARTTFIQEMVAKGAIFSYQ